MDHKFQKIDPPIDGKTVKALDKPEHKDPAEMTPKEISEEQLRQSREQTRLLRKILKYNISIWKDMV